MPKPPPADWLASFTTAAATSDMADALAVLEARATAHAGTPKSAEKIAACKEIMRAAGDDARALAAWCRWLAQQDSPTAKELLCVLLPSHYPRAPKQALRWLQKLSDDGSWEVREWAASALGELLDAHFDELLPVAQAWVRDDSQFVRRAVVVGAKYAAQKRHPERGKPLLDLIEPLVTDRAEEVRRNLGPFAIGDGYLRSYPKEPLAAVRRWARSDDEQSRWNAAMVFAAAQAQHHVDEALAVLSDLARDQRRYVWMAVSSALRNLVKRAPERVVPEIETWLQDDRRLPAALALRGVKREPPA
ncbi:MAG: DNA alkylation repair protein [Dehalococcoidia bacterium]